MGRPWSITPLAASMPLVPCAVPTFGLLKGDFRAPETIGFTRRPQRFAIALARALPAAPELPLVQARAEPAQEGERNRRGRGRATGCRESHGGPWMAHRGGPLERRWSERTLAQRGPDDRAEGFGYFCRAGHPEQKSLAWEGETKNISQNAASRNGHPNNQQVTHKLASPVSTKPSP
ncbi:hypothetical protein PSEUDO8Z_180086 [Pseudomonas sp. 8Z]|nr:hypothetical protein PSEUDO8Z_180086 [Pseudomonas sp. 8Z]